MNITVEQTTNDPSIAIMRLQGSLDASNYELVIEEAQTLRQAGVRFLLVDMSGVGFMASSGLVALHTAVMLMQGKPAPDLSAGWSVYHEIASASEQGLQNHVKLLDPQPKVHHTLEITGMHTFFEVHTDEQQALAAFDAA